MFTGKIKAIVSDFDGTLIGADQVMTFNLKSAIKSWVETGHVFSIASGRAYEGLIQKYCHELKLTDLHIVRGGSEIISGKNDEVIWGKYIKENLVEEILDELAKFPNIKLLAESGKNLYTKDGKGDPEFATGAVIFPFSQLPLNRVPKIAVPPLYDPESVEVILEDLKEKFPTLHIIKTSSARGVGIDVNDGGAGKHLAVLEYAKLMKLNPKEIMGIGDSYNDYPLLSACGLKVAMGNAPDELKKIADKVVGTQKENGVVDAINMLSEN
jgi:Cof subfamily protein (haloacid dehalogenase superfamily)